MCSFEHVDVAALHPTTVVVSHKPDGRWYVTFCVEANDPAPQPETGQAIGVDLGVKEFAVTSDRDRIANPKILERKASPAWSSHCPPEARTATPA